MIRTAFILAIAALGLSACRDDLNDTGTPTPTPTPLVTPTPVPGTDDEDTTDDSPDIDDEEDTADEDTDDSTSDGAPMVATNERVGVVSLNSALSQSLLVVQRTNGEIWEFQLRSIPTSRIGTLLIYRNSGLVFGSIDGVIIFDDGVAMSIEASVRVQ